MWAYDLVLDLAEVEHRLQTLKARSTKGTTGTQASFLALFDGDHAQVRALERRVAEKMGFAATFAVTGQTYSRKVDAQIVDTLSGIAQSAHKAATDLRLLASRKEVEEPFEAKQIGSSAMAYKRNPMRAERICCAGPLRHEPAIQSGPDRWRRSGWNGRSTTAPTGGWSFPRRFWRSTRILILYHNIASGLVVYPQVIARHLREELPFMATENILMAAVAAGGDRQELHERIRQHSQAAAANVKQQGGDNDLLDRLARDSAFAGLDWDRRARSGPVRRARSAAGRRVPGGDRRADPAALCRLLAVGLARNACLIDGVLRHGAGYAITTIAPGREFVRARSARLRWPGTRQNVQLPLDCRPSCTTRPHAPPKMRSGHADAQVTTLISSNNRPTAISSLSGVSYVPASIAARISATRSARMSGMSRMRLTMSASRDMSN